MAEGGNRDMPNEPPARRETTFREAFGYYGSTTPSRDKTLRNRHKSLFEVKKKNGSRTGTACAVSKTSNGTEEYYLLSWNKVGETGAGLMASRFRYASQRHQNVYEFELDNSSGDEIVYYQLSSSPAKCLNLIERQLSIEERQDVQQSFSAYTFVNQGLVVQLNFQLKKNSDQYELINQKQNVDLTFAKGAPIIIQLDRKDTVIGVLGLSNSNGSGTLYPVFHENTGIVAEFYTDVNEELHRYLAVDRSLNDVLAPKLQHYVEKKFKDYYTKLNSKCNLKNLTYENCVCQCERKGKHKEECTCDVYAELQGLAYENINNNNATFGRSERGRKNYEYAINDAVDLVKVHLPGHMANRVNGFEAVDLAALLWLLDYSKAPALPFFLSTSSSIQTIDSVRKVRNACAHYNRNDWTQCYFNDCFNKMEMLVEVMELGQETTLQLNILQSGGGATCIKKGEEAWRLKEELERKDEEMKGLNEKLKEKEKEVVTLKKKLEKMIEDMATLKKELEKKRKENDTLKEKLEEQREAIATLKEELEKQSEEIATLKEELKKKGDTMDTLTEELKRKVDRKDTEKLKAEVEEQGGKLECLGKEVTELKQLLKAKMPQEDQRLLNPIPHKDISIPGVDFTPVVDVEDLN